MTVYDGPAHDGSAKSPNLTFTLFLSKSYCTTSVLFINVFCKENY